MGWLGFAIGCFFLNGLVLVAIERASAIYGKGSGDHFLLVLYFAAAVLAGAYLVAKRRRPTWKEAGLGAITGTFSSVGNLFLFMALEGGASHLVLPIVFGSWMVGVALISRLAFKESLNPRMGVALVFGVASVVLLTVS